MNRVTKLEIGEDYVLTHNGNPYWKCDNYRQTIISKQINDEKDVIDLTNNTKGIYILTLENETSRLVKKMILE